MIQDSEGDIVKIAEDDEPEAADLGRGEAPQDAVKRGEVGRSLTVMSSLLVYSFLKWTYVLCDYIRHGVVAEGNIFLLFLVIPFGIPIWLIGVIMLLRTLWRRLKGGAGNSMPLNVKYVLVADCLFAVVCLVELVVIFYLTG